MASFILVSVVYAVAIGNPSFGNIAPFAAGLSLVIDIFASASCCSEVKFSLRHSPLASCLYHTMTNFEMLRE